MGSRVSVSNLIIIIELTENEGENEDMMMMILIMMLIDEDGEDDAAVDADRLNAPDQHIWIGQTPTTQPAALLLTTIMLDFSYSHVKLIY